MRAEAAIYLRLVEIDVYEPGSPAPLFLFHRWCRASVELAVMQHTPPTLFFFDGPELDGPTFEHWQLKGTPPALDELLASVIVALASGGDASQIGVCVPFGGDEPGALLVVIDESGLVAERATVAVVDDHLELGSWTAADVSALPISTWQTLLAATAGYDEFAKWRCNRCLSVCPGEAAKLPAPCDFCGSDEIERVPLTTPLAPPQPPYNDELDAENPSPAIVLGIIDDN